MSNHKSSGQGKIEMGQTIFWSWQSDRNERVSRHLIRDALVIALERLTSGSDIEERLELDHDTKGLPGSPDIVASILEKIDQASVFVGDITPIAIADGGKQVANPNVLIELGYAKKSLGTARVITVWNTAFTNCRVEDLPFDLRGKRGPISYNLNTGATKSELASARETLVGGFVDRISGCLESPENSGFKNEWQPSVEGDPSIWIPPGTPIPINEVFGSGTKTFVDGGRWYVRILPSKFDPMHLDGGAYAPLVDFYGGFSCGDTTGGKLTYEGSVRADNAKDELTGASMWFRSTGEIWISHAGVSGSYQGRNDFFGDYIPEKWASSISQALKMSSEKGAAGPYKIRLGVTRLDGLTWPMGRYSHGSPPVSLEPNMEAEFSAAGAMQADWIQGFLDAWQQLRRVFSRPAPKQDEIDEAIRKIG